MAEDSYADTTLGLRDNTAEQAVSMSSRNGSLNKISPVRLLSVNKAGSAVNSRFALEYKLSRSSLSAVILIRLIRRFLETNLNRISGIMN